MFSATQIIRARLGWDRARFRISGKGQKVVFHEAYHNKFRIARLRDQVPFSIGRAFLYFSEFWTELGTEKKIVYSQTGKASTTNISD